MSYLYEVTYKKDGEQDYIRVRAADKEGAAREASKQVGDLTLISVSRIGN